MFEQVCESLANKKLTIFFLESASAGFLAYKFSLNQHSGDILSGGLVCYDLKVKEKILKIQPSIIEKHTAESIQVTEQMIKKGKKLFKSDIYISCTGLLKNGGSETKEKQVGTFFYCISYKKKIYNFKSKYKGNPKVKLEKLLNDVSKSLLDIIKKGD